MKLTKPLVTALLLLLLLALLWSPKATAQDYDIYVSDAGNFSQPPWQILKFDQNGENPEVFITENLDWPHDIVFLEDTNSVLISNFNSGRIDRYNASTGHHNPPPAQLLWQHTEKAVLYPVASVSTRHTQCSSHMAC